MFLFKVIHQKLSYGGGKKNTKQINLSYFIDVLQIWGSCQQLWLGSRRSEIGWGTMKYLWELSGSPKYLNIHKGAAKTFWVILPQMCLWVLWHNHTVSRVWIFFFHIWKRAAKLFCMFEGGSKFVYHCRTFHPPPPGPNCWQLPLILEKKQIKL